jgi:cell division protein ZapB
MSEANPSTLATKVDQLIELVQKLDEQNRHLQTQNLKLKEERAQLLKIHEGTRNRVESMLNRLRVLEKSS